MKDIIEHTDPVLLVGDGDLVASIAVCLLNAGHQVIVCGNSKKFTETFNRHINSQAKDDDYADRIIVDEDICKEPKCKLAIVITPEKESEKIHTLKKVTDTIAGDVIVAINTESISLKTLQQSCSNPQRLIGLNWSEPAHTTSFLEVIETELSSETAAEIIKLAKTHWGKDPYVVENDGIRGRLISAMAREAAYLIENKYASYEDIDRACRNDAGYYLPFSGNCRYMDLMGTYAYGMVMKDLNPDLSKDKELPSFIKKILNAGGNGMENKKGFYNYTDEDVEKWRNQMDKFSYEIQAIIEKYPFNYNKESFTD